MRVALLLSMALTYAAGPAAFGFGAGTGAIFAQDASSPLFDGRCNEYASLGQQHHSLASGVDLHVFQDDDYVWLCYSLPADSHGTLDMYVDAPGLTAPLNLHVSAQLGEWPVDGDMPGTATSEQWWQVDGWWANAGQFNGSRGEGADRRPYFRPSEGREIQMSKERFGRGEWKLQFNIHGVQLPGNARGRIMFPEDLGEGREVMLLQVR